MRNRLIRLVTELTDAAADEMTREISASGVTPKARLLGEATEVAGRLKNLIYNANGEHPDDSVLDGMSIEPAEILLEAKTIGYSAEAEAWEEDGKVKLKVSLNGGH